MSDNIVSTAAEELKKWLEVLEKLLSKMEADKASAAKAALDTKRFDAMIKELKEIKEGINQLPDDTPGKKEAIETAEKAEQKTKQEMDPDAPGNDLNPDAPGKDVDSPKNDLAQDAVDAEVLEGAGEHVLDDGSGKQSTGESIGWTKGEKGWENSEGLSIKELGSSIQIGSAGGVGV